MTARLLALGRASALALLLIPVAAPLSAQDDAVREVIRRHVEQIRTAGALEVGGAQVASVVVLPDLYERRNFEPTWTRDAAVDGLFGAIDDAFLDGLDPDDYHRQALTDLRGAVRGGGDPATVAAFDVLLTDALVRLGYHVLFGKVNPYQLDSDWNLSRELGHSDPEEVVQGAIDAPDLHAVVEGYKLQDPFYVDLKESLAWYRAIETAGGWDPVPDVRRLELDSVDARVPALRARLAATDDLPSSATLTSETFDQELDQAVRSFQRRHGLTDDGIVGTNTVAAMNVPVSDRIDQLRVNLERARWLLRDLGDTFVIVNIAGFQVYVVENRQTIWTSRVVVGTTYHKTPLFKADMKYLVVNPTWTIPPGILRNETIPALQRDPNYLPDHNMTLLDRAGNAVDPSGVDFSQYSARNFPFVVRQEPGPWNALGQVKFIFPNDHFVFLHDTPSRNLFTREVRAFSHGCIRVENPLDLAEVLLRNKSGWGRDAIDRQLATGDLKTVYLDEPLPTVLAYWTAWVDLEGQLTFYDDVYDRDGAVLAELEEAFTFGDRSYLSGDDGS